MVASLRQSADVAAMARATVSLEERRDRILTEPVTRVLFALSWPMTLGLFSVIAINVTDTFYIGRLGAEELAAIGFCFPVIFGMSAIAIGMGNGGAAVVSRAIGAGRQDQARYLIASTMIFVGIFAAILGVIMLQVSDSVFLALGARPDLLPLINAFMTIWYIGLPTLVLPIVLNGLIRASGEAMVPSVLMVVAAIINAAVSPLLIFGLLGFPELGMKGAALATILARAIISILAVGWLLREKLIAFEAETLRSFLPCIHQVMRYGAPAFLAQLVSPIGSAVATRLLADAGPSVVAGFAVGARVEALALIPFFALQTGITPFIGQNVGARRDERLAKAERNVWGFSILWGVIGALILWSFGESLGFLFTDDPAIAASTDAYLEAIAFGLWAAGLLYVSIGIFNPLGYPNLALAMNALRFVGLYAGLSLVAVNGFGAAADQAVFTSAWVSLVLTGLVSAVLIHFLLRRPNRADLPSARPAPESVAASNR
ncbi:MAG: MATE family efflux transporter [Pseudomonadota bacterium]